MAWVGSLVTVPWEEGGGGGGEGGEIHFQQGDTGSTHKADKAEEIAEDSLRTRATPRLGCLWRRRQRRRVCFCCRCFLVHARSFL